PAPATPAPAAPAAVQAAPAPAAPATAPAAAAAEPKIVVEAVEIDGNKIFVAGTADPGLKVRAYANDILLGDAQTSPDGHFLIEATRDIPVGSYTIHVDGLGDDGVKVVARAAVPFEREPGESVAAVAPAETKPAETKPAAPATA
ncbi:LysM peptidoglycan-binding domain-containing protein, partial [Mesorhizobium sp.]